MTGRISAILLLAALLGCGQDSEGSFASAGDPSEAVFDQASFRTFRFSLDPAEWDALVADPHDETWRRAAMDWDGEVVADVALRASGVTTRIPGHPKPSLRLDFDVFAPGRRWRGLGHLRLDAFVRDESFLRDRLSYAVYRELGLAAPRAVHARVEVNGAFTGVYGVEEVVKKPFLERHFGRDGRLYELLHLESNAPDPYRWVDGAASSYVPFPFEPETEETAADPSDVLRLIETLNLEPIATRRAALDARALDVGRFLGYLAALQALADYDGITASWGSNNHSWARPPGSDRFVIVPWDPEFSLGLFGMSPQRSLWAGTDRSAATSWIAQDAEATATFKARVRDVAAGPFSRLPARIDEYHAQIRDAVHADRRKHKSDAAFDASPAALKGWIEQRLASLAIQAAP